MLSKSKINGSRFAVQKKKKQTARLDNTQFGLVYPHIKYL